MHCQYHNYWEFLKPNFVGLRGEEGEGGGVGERVI